MGFLYYCIISAVIAIGTKFIVNRAVENRIKREHPELIPYLNCTYMEKIASYLPTLVPAINNILTLLWVLGQDYLYDSTIDKLKSRKYR